VSEDNIAIAAEPARMVLSDNAILVRQGTAKQQ
jgi:hypothetical protein